MAVADPWGTVIGGLLNCFPDFGRVPEILDMYREKVPFKITVLASPAPNVDLNFSGALGPWAPLAPLGPQGPRGVGVRPKVAI